MIPTPDDSIKDGKILEPERLIKQLQQLKQNIRWYKNRVNLCLGPQTFYMRRVQLPPMTEPEISKAMRLEVEKHFPLTAEEAVFDYCPVNCNPGSRPKAREYLLAAAKNNIADSYTAVAESAGFNTAALEIMPLSLLRSLLSKRTSGRSNISNQGPALRVLLDAGFNDSALLITRGEEYQLYRNLKIGLGNFYQAALQANNGNHSKMHRQVYTRVTLAERNLEKTADLFASKIVQSLTYWGEQSSLSEPEVQSFEICGGGAFIPGLATYLGSRLDIKPSLFNPLPFFTGTSFIDNPEQYREESFYTAAFGLALRGWIQ